MDNAFFLSFTLLISLTVFCYALMIQYWNKKTINRVIHNSGNSDSSLYYGNKAYIYFLGKRIKQLKLVLMGLIFLFVGGMFNHEYLNKAPVIYNQDMMLIFTVMWFLLFLLLKFEFIMIHQYKTKIFCIGEDEDVENSFRTIRSFYRYINRMINTMTMSCLSLLLVIVI